MRTFRLNNIKSNKIIYEGVYNNIINCLEDAVHKNINLEYVDLRYKNLSCANIDSAKLYGADFSHSNLNHANLSESNLNHATFRNTTLIGTCLSGSELKGADMMGASFGATEIQEAIFDNVYFSTLSALDLTFYEAKSMKYCTFETIHNDTIIFSAPPIAIKGLLNKPIYIFENIVLFGHKSLPFNFRNILGDNKLLLPLKHLAG